MAHEVEQVETGMTGWYQVMTETGSTYILDLDAMTQTRIPVDPNLRRDYETMPLLHIEPIRAGHPAVMVLDLRRDGVVTTRITSPIVQMWQLDGADQA